jgi:exonuclease I
MGSASTTGLSPAFDQILQLAAIRTGASFSKSEPGVEIHDLRIRRARRVARYPTAMLLTPITGADLDCGLPFVEAMCRALLFGMGSQSRSAR